MKICVILSKRDDNLEIELDQKGEDTKLGQDKLRISQKERISSREENIRKGYQDKMEGQYCQTDTQMAFIVRRSCKCYQYLFDNKKYYYKRLYEIMNNTIKKF